jgi:hypothetical protein
MTTFSPPSTGSVDTLTLSEPPACSSAMPLSCGRRLTEMSIPDITLMSDATDASPVRGSVSERRRTPSMR